MRPSAEHQAEARRIAAELAAIARTGQLLPGTIGSRLTRCGHPNCRCRDDPPQRHGPYWQWTRKVAAKTVGRWLSPEQAEDYKLWWTTPAAPANCSPNSRPSAPPPSTPTPAPARPADQPSPPPMWAVGR